MTVVDRTLLDQDDALADVGSSVEEAAPLLGEAAASSERTPPPFEPLRLAPGELVPGTRYRIVRWLGEGRTGVVYEGAHVDIERRVALKILRPEHSVGERAIAFRKEARTTSRIGSPYIVEVLDFAPLPDGRLMFAMEAVSGKSLGSLVAAAPLPASRVIPLLRQICKGLSAAHAEGVVHRDIKPDNVLVYRRGERDDAVKLLDFGVATRARVGETGEFGTAGTARYMAPEQIEGEAIDGRADIYGLGCTAYALFAGHPPFDGESVEEIFRRHAVDEPAPLPDGTPRPLTEIILRCLAKRPDDRFADVDELEAALCQAQIDLGLATPWDDLELPPIDLARRRALQEGIERLAPQRRSHARRVWPVLLVGGLALFALLGWLAFPAQSPPSAPDEITAMQHEARAAAAKAYFVIPPVDDAGQATAYLYVQRLEQLEGDLELQGRTAAAELRQEFADTLVRLGNTYWSRPGGTPFAMDYYAWALVFQADRKEARERVFMTPGELALLRQRAETGEFTDVERETAQLLVVLADDDAGRRDAEIETLLSSRRSLSTARRLEALVAREEPKPPEKLKPDEVAPTAEPTPTIDAAESTTGDDPEKAAELRDPWLAEKLAGEAEALVDQNRFDAAAKKFRQALEADDTAHRAMYGLGLVAFERAAYSEALDHLRRATRRKPLGKYFLLRAQAEERLQKFADARSSYERAAKLGAAGADKALQKFLARQGN